MFDVLQRITDLRLARNWSEYQLSVRSGLPQSTISSWYRKKNAAYDSIFTKNL